MTEKNHWFRLALQLQGSVIPAIAPRVLACAGFGILISLLYQLKLPVSVPNTFIPILSVVLGLLLVFRTNTAYDRFWEGRKSWANLILAVRNLTRQILVTVEERSPQDRQEKVATLRLLVAFAVAMKLYLRSEPVNSELEELISPSQYAKLQSIKNPPLEIALWIGEYLQDQHKRTCLAYYHLTGMNQLINSMIDALTACERILKTPMPLAYAIHLKHLLLLYSLALPFQLVKDLMWGVGPSVGLISFALFGIEEIGIEIENPFGYDKNDLPLDTICDNMRRNMEDLISLQPSVNIPSGDGNMTGA